MLTRILITAVMLIALHFISITGLPRLIGYLIAYGVIGYDILRKAFKGILNGQVFDENFLALMDIRPDYANIEKDGKIEKVFQGMQKKVMRSSAVALI